jgi:hypothetical protein
VPVQGCTFLLFRYIPEEEEEEEDDEEKRTTSFRNFRNKTRDSEVGRAD